MTIEIPAGALVPGTSCLYVLVLRWDGGVVYYVGRTGTANGSAPPYAPAARLGTHILGAVGANGTTRSAVEQLMQLRGSDVLQTLELRFHYAIADALWTYSEISSMEKEIVRQLRSMGFELLNDGVTGNIQALTDAQSLFLRELLERVA